MRYSMVVYLSNMCGTLLEAARYLRTEPDSPQSEELRANGRLMLEQIQCVLQQHSGDLHSQVLLTRTEELMTAWESFDSSLESGLEQLRQLLPKEIRYQVRAVFLAELGEKWDAMESVYLFMRDDPRFDPVVVRTPVFRELVRNGVRERETIYRDFLTPMGIPSLGYEQYSFEKDCPDLAFSSQPYDSCALPQFWAENVAKYTRLVYLPYFINDRIMDDAVVNWCRLPIHIFAWKVTQPNVKQLSFYRQHSPHGGANALLTGIPKMDYLFSVRQSKPVIPESWNRLKGKKVVLWNSWYDARLSTLRYYREIINWFRENPDFALIWRKHPMTETVTKLYYPKLFSTLIKYIHELETLPNAVVDYETSYAPAFIVSDAMISDFSSLLTQYLFMNKPALIVRSNVWNFVGEDLINTSWEEKAEDIDGIISFLERVRKGEDCAKYLRRRILSEDLPLADGHVAQRLCNSLWDSMHQEDYNA